MARRWARTCSAGGTSPSPSTTTRRTRSTWRPPRSTSATQRGGASSTRAARTSPSPRRPSAIGRRSTPLWRARTLRRGRTSATWPCCCEWRPRSASSATSCASAERWTGRRGSCRAPPADSTLSSTRCRTSSSASPPPAPASSCTGRLRSPSLPTRCAPCATRRAPRPPPTGSACSSRPACCCPASAASRRACRRRTGAAARASSASACGGGRGQVRGRTSPATSLARMRRTTRSSTPRPALRRTSTPPRRQA
mmetsp:Transcript_4472/g.14853  ORF Transcript_4472/g.14853 Transcript_4472/m.14853 type:complete len:253 (+) Transcript_4472:942-1700(+)